MGFDNSFCTVVQACVTLLLPLALSECHYVEKRNVLLIVGNTSQFFYVYQFIIAALTTSNFYANKVPSCV